MQSIFNKFLLGIGLVLALAAGTASAATATPVQERERLLGEVKSWVAQHSGVPAGRVDIGALDNRLRVQSCAEGMRFDFPFPARDLVRARCLSPLWELYIRVSIRALRNQMIAARPLAAGSVIEEADLELRAIDDEVADGIGERSLALGRLLKRALPKGTPILARDLEDSARVLRLTLALQAEQTLAAGAYKVEIVPRALVPAGAALGVVPDEGARVLRPLPAGHILLASDLSDARRILVARENLLPGREVEPRLFELRLVSVRDKSQRYFADFAGLEFMELARTLQPGDPVSAADLRPAMLVLRGQLVLLSIAGGGGLEITVRAESLQDGRMGELIQLKNPESGRLLSAVVTGKGTARPK